MDGSDFDDYATLTARLADLERCRIAVRQAVASLPRLSEYHGPNGFEVERFIEAYNAAKARIREALER